MEVLGEYNTSMEYVFLVGKILERLCFVAQYLAQASPNAMDGLTFIIATNYATHRFQCKYKQLSGYFNDGQCIVIAVKKLTDDL